MRLRIAVSGALWFAFVATAVIPLAVGMSLTPSIRSMTLSTVNWGGTLASIGVPAGVAGFLLGNTIARSPGAVVAFLVGVLLVVVSHLLAGVWFSAFARTGISPFSFAFNAFSAGLGMLLLSTTLLKGIPLVLGGLSALIFQEIIQRLDW
jgi:hypothetical protein